MQIRILLSILFFFGLSVSSAIAQGKLIMLNGKEKRFSTAEVKGEIIVYQPEDTTRNVNRKVDKYDVFAIVRADGSEEIIYNPDTVSGEDPTVAEVRDYIKGEQYADLVYKKPGNFVTAFQLGAVSGFTLPIFYGVAVPLLYPLAIAQFNPKIEYPIQYSYSNTGTFTKIHSDSLSNIIINDSFSAGYNKKASNIKVKNSLLGGSVGFAFGVIAIGLLIAK